MRRSRSWMGSAVRWAVTVAPAAMVAAVAAVGPGAAPEGMVATAEMVAMEATHMLRPRVLVLGGRSAAAAAPRA